MPTITAYPTTVTVLSDAGTSDWTNVNNALALDGVFTTSAAVVPHSTTITSHAIKAVGFDLSAINDSDTINSVSLILNRKSDRNLTNQTLAYLVENGTITSLFNESVPAYWTDTLTAETLTKTTSLPTVTVLQSATSGLTVATTFYDADSQTVTASIDSIALSVNYTTASRSAGNYSGKAGLRPIYSGKVGLREYMAGKARLRG